MTEKIAVVGLGYVGLPVAVAFAQAYPRTIGFDVSSKRVKALQAGDDWTGECTPQTLSQTDIQFTCDPKDLDDATFFVVAVPTPIDANRQPDLGALKAACEIVGPHLKAENLVVFESTVYPGVTEDFCGPILENASGLSAGKDFHLGYSPERINPGDKEHTIDKIVKVVSGDDEPTLERVAQAYAQIVPAGIHRAQTIKVAEAAKVIENTQRDLNIALMNELALIFDRLDIRTQDVLSAAKTKWNFLPFSPGLVGGHCIGVDPYYLTAKAESVGHHPEVILSGRRINDAMGGYIAQKLIKMLTQQGRALKDARVGVLGLTFKENVSDLRNSKVPDIINELRDFQVTPLVHDPLADPEEALSEYGLDLSALEALTNLDGLVLAVPHGVYTDMGPNRLEKMLAKKAAIVDVKSVLDPRALAPSHLYWSL